MVGKDGALGGEEGGDTAWMATNSKVISLAWQCLFFWQVLILGGALFNRQGRKTIEIGEIFGKALVNTGPWLKG